MIADGLDDRHGFGALRRGRMKLWGTAAPSLSGRRHNGRNAVPALIVKHRESRESNPGGCLPVKTLELKVLLV